MLSVVMLNVVMLSAIMLYHYAECHYAECRYPVCHYAECRYPECHFAERRCAAELTLSAEEKKFETALKHYPLQTNTNLLGVVLVRPIEPFPVILAELSNEIKSFTLKKNLFSRRGKEFYKCF
jgi:hypothetical protein